MKNNNLARYAEEIEYDFERLAKDYKAGQHKSSVVGSGFRVKGFESIFDRPDFSQVDWNSTVVSGSRTPLVKIVDQKSSITVVGIVDATASMSFSGTVEKFGEIAKFVVSLGYSAYKIGDKFSVIAYGNKVIGYFEPMTYKNYSLEIGEWLEELVPEESGSEGLTEALDYLPREKPCLVFWLSDFNKKPEVLANFLDMTVGVHHIVPVIFWDSAEYNNLPKWGLAHLRDPETGEVRPEFLTPWRQREIKEAFENRRSELAALMAGYGVEPIFVLDKFEPAAVTNFFLEHRS